ncbi:MAG: porin family protein [Chlorobium sp.]|nr:MAG: porin family protein [Chlorobium sp.]
MKKLLLTALIAGMSAAPALANPYISGSVGLGIFGNSDLKDPDTGVLYTGANGQTYKSGIPFGGAIGLKHDAYRFEAALGYQSNDLKSYEGESITSGDSVSTLTYMLNGYYDIDVKSKSISPYVMAGLGGASITAKNTASTSDPIGHPAEEKSTSVFAWQVGAGVGIKAANNLTVDLGYRYLKPSKYNDSWGEYTVSSSNFLAGIRYDFQ